ncbi:MAG: lactoylglutathione lyase [Ectothiorhodospiraceae bacterium]|nr:lactoylglutathione lyase [Ectothiorhodospiraceae bacterium]
MSRHFEQAQGLCENPDPETEQYLFNQTMMRIKDPGRTLDFYTRGFGMRLIRKLDFPEMKFTLYFLGMVDDEEAKRVPDDDAERTRYTFSQPAMLELTHNWGTEDDPDFSYHNGNEQPQGFGHIGFDVPDVYKACERLEAMGAEFVKRPDDGRLKGIAFVKDPDGYWVELFESRKTGAFGR